MDTVGLFLNPEKEQNIRTAEKVIETVEALGGRVITRKTPALCLNLPKIEHLNDVEFFARAQAAISLGGDGTLLSVARQVAPYGIPVLGVNLGHLGFLSELERDDFHLLARLLSGDFVTEERMMLDICVQDGVQPRQYLALNDAVVSRGSSSKLLDLRICADGHALNHYTADGIVVSTPTGSTAYSLSAGGPVMEPDIEVLSIVPICPHTLYSRPIVLSSERELRICARSRQDKNVLLAVDGNSVELASGCEITIKKSALSTKLVRMKDRNFYDVLRQKLS